MDLVAQAVIVIKKQAKINTLDRVKRIEKRNVRLRRSSLVTRPLPETYLLSSNLISI